MKTTLLVIRNGETYIRFTENGHEACSLNKASVYPPVQIENCLQKLQQLHAAGESGALIRRLTIIEEPWEG